MVFSKKDKGTRNNHPPQLLLISFDTSAIFMKDFWVPSYKEESFGKIALKGNKEESFGRILLKARLANLLLEKLRLLSQRMKMGALYFTL